MSRLKKVIFTLVPSVVFPAVFFYDVIRSTVDLELTSIVFLRELAIVLAFISLYYLIEGEKPRIKKGLPREIGRLLVVGFGALILSGLVTLFSNITIVQKGGTPVPQGAMAVFLSVLIGVALGVVSILMLLTIRSLILYKQRRGTKRNFVILLVILFLTCGASTSLVPIERSIGTILFFATILFIVFNSFKQSWIVYLSRREKIYCIVYSALLFLTTIFLSALVTNESVPKKLIIAFSLPLHTFVQLTAIFASIYFGMAFVSTLFHLPTAEVFERKQSELSSLHNLSRLVTQVFDFNDLVNTVTQMTLEVCGAKSSWLELVKPSGDSSGTGIEVVAQRNITNEQIENLTGGGKQSLRQHMSETKKTLLIDDILTDRRLKHSQRDDRLKGSILSVPLLSHSELIGSLHATKDVEYGFDQDDIDVLTTFADHVTIAIENSKLIAKSIERERLHQEMMVAQRMQQRLLPQSVPDVQALDIAAISESSLEVGGDYYDFVQLGDGKFGIVVGDVSGKGVSAAFYMAEVKGIFLSLSTLCSSPRELLVRANHTLMNSLERNAFISLIYVVIDTHKATMHLARAGHCPAVYITADGYELVRPTGLGLGLTNGAIFEESTEERKISFKKGDVCVFYTDGITESRDVNGEEYGYERLTKTAIEAKNYPAAKIKDRILEDVRTFMGNSSHGDDMTLVVLKWLGN
jgi:sigma-B regulation protein RsbU (phosphoserine phosphatase)